MRGTGFISWAGFFTWVACGMPGFCNFASAQVERNCEAANSVGFSQVVINSREDWVNIMGVGDLGDPEELCLAEGEVFHEGPPGATIRGCIYVNIIHARFDGAQGWAFNIELDGNPDFKIAEVITNGTAVSTNIGFIDPCCFSDPNNVDPNYIRCEGPDVTEDVEKDFHCLGRFLNGLNWTQIVETNKPIFKIEKCPENGLDPVLGAECEPGEGLMNTSIDKSTGDLIQEPRYAICPSTGSDPDTGTACTPEERIIDRIVNQDRRGIVSVVKLATSSFGPFTTLEEGTTTVLKLCYEGIVPTVEDYNGSPAGTFSFSEELVGDRGSFQNNITIQGTNGDVSNFDTAKASIFLVPGPLKFLRGGPNPRVPYPVCGQGTDADEQLGCAIVIECNN